MAGVKEMFLLIIFQGFYLGSGGQRWTFPSIITALVDSCVEIPCTYHPAGSSGTSSPVWYLDKEGTYPVILNTKDSSSVMEEYKGRTSLVPGNNSCALRIDPVREEDTDRYYPGIAEDRKMNAKKLQSKSVRLSVTDSPGNIDLHMPENIREEATTIRCRIDHTCRSSPPALQWNKPGQVKKQSVQVSGGIWREESELTYIPSSEDDGSSVRCTATYPNGRKDERSGKLNIHYSAVGVHITVKKGSVFTALSCDFFRSRPDVTHYTWMKDGSILPNEARKTLTIDTNEDGQYSCIAHNTAGNSSSEEILMESDRANLHLILPLAIGFGVLAFVILIICLKNRLCSCCQKRKSPADGNPNLVRSPNGNDEGAGEETQQLNSGPDRNDQQDSRLSGEPALYRGGARQYEGFNPRSQVVNSTFAAAGPCNPSSSRITGSVERRSLLLTSGNCELRIEEFSATFNLPRELPDSLELQNSAMMGISLPCDDSVLCDQITI